MKRSFLTPRIKRVLIPPLLTVFAVPGPASAAEQGGWLESLFDRSDALAQATENNVTPSHVFRATRDLLAEIQILRDELGVYDYPAEAEPQEDRAPVHVYAKTLEVLSKVTRVQRRYGMTPGDVGQIPVKEIVPGDVLRSVNGILDEVRRIKTQMVIEAEIDPAEFAGGKTPSMVYKNLADASFLLDGLRGRPLTPTDVYGNAVAILDELELIAAKMKVPLRTETPEVNGAKKPTEVAQQVLRATYKVINLQTRLGMDASAVPTLTLVRVTPSEVYDATNMLMAEMNRIKVHLGINLPREPRPDARNKRPEDVFAQVMLIIQNLDTMTKAASA